MRALLEDGVTDELDAIGDGAVCSAAQGVAGTLEEGIVVDEALGRTRLDLEGEGVDAETPFDVASLTKPMVTATLWMRAIGEGRADWHDPIGMYLDLRVGDDGENPTILQLLNHTSGLPDWAPLYGVIPTDEVSLDRHELNRRALEGIATLGFEELPGTSEIYSDLGYIVLAAALEEVYGARLDEVADAHIFEPLGLEHTGFVPLDSDRTPLESAVATEIDHERGGTVAGIVHDRNAAALGGVTGHAGVFSTAREVWQLGRHLAALDRGGLDEGEGIVDRDVLRFGWSNEARGGVGHHLGGWDTPSGESSSAGEGFRAGWAVGHLGFTGTSIWIERKQGIIAVLLTNRTYPSRDNDRIHDLRVRYHEAILSP